MPPHAIDGDELMEPLYIVQIIRFVRNLTVNRMAVKKMPSRVARSHI
jgi:hypothetical protein